MVFNKFSVSKNINQKVILMIFYIKKIFNFFFTKPLISNKGSGK